MRDRSEFYDDNGWRSHLDFELGLAQRTGNKKYEEHVEKELAKLDGGKKPVGRPRKNPEAEHRA